MKKVVKIASIVFIVLVGLSLLNMGIFLPVIYSVFKQASTQEEAQVLAMYFVLLLVATIDFAVEEALCILTLIFCGNKKDTPKWVAIMLGIFQIVLGPFILGILTLVYGIGGDDGKQEDAKYVHSAPHYEHRYYDEPSVKAEPVDADKRPSPSDYDAPEAPSDDNK